MPFIILPTSTWAMTDPGVCFGRNFTPDALPYTTLTIQLGLGPAQGIQLLVPILWLIWQKHSS